MLAWLIGTMAIAQDAEQPEEAKQPGIVSVDVGFDQNVKLGKWLPVSILVCDIQPTRFAITAPDGNGNQVKYSGELTQVGEDTYQAWVCVGRVFGNLKVALLDAKDERLGEQTISLSSSQFKIAASTSKLTVTIGANDATDTVLGKTIEELYGEEGGTIVGLKRGSQLPVHWFGYDGVNTVFLLSTDIKQIQEVQPRQWQALESWVMRGGRLFVSSNGSEGALSAEGPLARFNIGEFSETTILKSMIQLDNFTKKRLDAKKLPIAQIKVTDGNTILAQKGQPLIVRQSRGSGQIVFISFDLADPAFVDWKGLPVMFSQLLESQAAGQSSRNADSGRSRASHLGYTDLSGQMKVPLEQFSQVQLVNFTMVAVLIGLYLLCIGPGDFFLLKKVFRKMEMTWVTFTLVTLLFSGLAIGLANWSRPKILQVNQLEIIDIDSVSKRFHGTTWTNIFSPESVVHSLSFNADNEFGLNLDSQLSSWLGSPGNGLGGMQTKAGFSTGQGGYEIASQSVADGPVSTSLEEVPLQVSSSMAMLTHWSGSFEPRIESRLRSTTTQLEGQITNPLDVELTNVRVMFENYVYILDNLDANETLDLLSGPRVRTLKSYMTGRKKTTEKTDRGQNVPWDPSSADLERIADMMMFYSAAGGKDYTSLTHGFQNRVEMKDQLYCGRAVMVAQIKSNVGRVTIDGKSSDDFADRQTTLLRFILPVEKKSR